MARDKEFWHYGVPTKGRVIILYFYLESYEEWTVRICKVTDQIQRIVANAKDTTHPCRWHEPPQFVLNSFNTTDNDERGNQD